MLVGPSNSNSPVPASPTPSNQLPSTNTSQNESIPRLVGHQTLQSPTATPSPQQNQSGQRHSSVEEHRRLFSRQSRIQPYGGIGGRPISQQRGRSGMKKEKSVSGTMFCLADKNQTHVPSCSEKLELLHNGLGEKRIAFPSLATSSTVKDLLYEAYSPLKHTGGFQILLSSKEKSRKELRVVSHSCGSTEQIRCLGTGRIYIRPLQRSIPINQQLTLKEEFEDCLSCLFSIPISQMQEHRENCVGFPTSSSDGNDNDEADVELEASGRSFAHDGEPPENNNERSESSSAGRGATSGENNYRIGSGDANESSVLVEQVNAAPIPVINLVDDNRSLEEPSLTNNIEQVDRDETYADHVKNAIRSTLSEMADCEEPVTVLRTFQHHFLRGRPLDIESVSSICEAKTTEIVVSRLNLFEDGMDELTESGHDPSVPLEITFTGECAADYCGPRREFLGAMVREIKDRLFMKEHEENTSFALTNNIVAKSKRHYYGAGIVFGYSMLQGGPLPCFIDESLLKKVFGKEPESLKESEAQLGEGLAKFGLVELFQKKPCLCHLLRITAVAEINYHKLVKLFVPSFSPDGSNQRMREEKSYRYLINYMKEVAAARRGSLELGDILKFATGSANEPVLGYRLKPTICFNDDMPSCIPTSNTCVNKMTLAIGDIVPNNKEEMFRYFDYTFANDYFGMV